MQMSHPADWHSKGNDHPSSCPFRGDEEQHRNQPDSQTVDLLHGPVTSDSTQREGGEDAGCSSTQGPEVLGCCGGHGP